MRALGLCAFLLVAIAIRAIDLNQPGYATDEDLTHFAVEGIVRHGVPALPSGFIYDRGLPYSYLAWSGRALTRLTAAAQSATADTAPEAAPSMTAYRAVSLLAGAITIVLVFALARDVGGDAAGITAALLVVSYPWHIIVSQWARFYASFLAVYLLALISYDRIDRRGGRVAFLVGVLFARLLHEFGATLLFLPIASLLLNERDRRIAWPSLLWTGLTLAFAQAVIYGIHALAPNDAVNPVSHYLGVHARQTLLPIPTSVVRLAGPVAWTCGLFIAVAVTWVLTRRIVVSPAFALAAAISGLFFQLGLLCWLLVVAVLAAPHRWRRYFTAAVVVTAVSTMGWMLVALATTEAAMTLGYVTSIVDQSLSYPTAAARYIALYYPLTILLAAVTAVVAMSRPPAHDRLRRLLVIVAFWLILLGVITSGFEPRHLVPVLTLMFVIVAQLPRVVAPTDRTPHGSRRLMIAGVLVVAATVWDQYGAYAKESGRDLRQRFDRPMLVAMRAPSLEGVRMALGRDDLLICSDELACLYWLGRVDYWLAVAPFDRERYAIDTAAGRRALYAGSPIVASLEALRDIVSAAAVSRRCWIVLLDTGKFTRPAEQDVRAKLGGLGLVLERAAPPAPGVIVLRVGP